VISIEQGSVHNKPAESEETGPREGIHGRESHGKPHYMEEKAMESERQVNIDRNLSSVSSRATDGLIAFFL
jgi:hypothetical protein